MNRLKFPRALRPLDHVVFAVRDLDAAGAFYERLGFIVGARNRHPWGTENRIIQFNSAFIELITVGEGADIPPHAPGVFSFGAFIRDYLERVGEGFAMIAMRSANAEADRGLFEAGGIGGFAPFNFERIARKPDGTEARVAFSLAFASNPKVRDAGFFTCQHHEPQNFWNPAFQKHPNGSIGIMSAIMASRRPKAIEPFMRIFCAVPMVRPIDEGFGVALPNGNLDVLTPEIFNGAFGVNGNLGGLTDSPRFVGITIHAAPAVIASGLKAEGIPFEIKGLRVVVPAREAFGVAIAFAPLARPRAA